MHHDHPRDVFPSANEDGHLKPAGPNGPTSVAAENTSSKDSATNDKPSDMARDENISEIERIASAVDLAIALEDN